MDWFTVGKWAILVLLFLFVFVGVRAGGRRRYTVFMADGSKLNVRRTFSDSWNDGWATRCFHVLGGIDENGKAFDGNDSQTKVTLRYIVRMQEDKGAK